MKKQNPALIYGLIGGAIIIVFGLVIQMYMTSTMQKAVDSGESFNFMKLLGVGIISFLLIAAVYIFCIVKSMKDYRKINPEYTYGKLVGYGLFTTLIIAVVSTIFTLIYSQVIDPGATKKSLALSEKLIENSNMPDDQKEKALDRIKMQNENPGRQIITSTGITLICGLIVSLIAAAVLNKRGKEFPTNPNLT
jgi:ABC-type antimicrobial peptide transport system permease subunit